MRHRLAHMAGIVITLTSVVYIGVLAARQREALLSFAPSPSDAVLIASGAIAYAGAGALLALAWRHVLLWTGEPDVGIGSSFRIYGRTQIAKYIPGNVAQLAGRQIAGRAAGWSHAGLALSSLFELLTLLYVGAAAALAGFGMAGLQSGHGTVAAGILIVLTVFAAAFPAVSSRLVLSRYPDLAARLRNCRISGLWPAALAYAAFFIIGGLMLLLTVRIASPSATGFGGVPAAVGLFAASWFAGVVTPGAPSGLGVREAILVTGLAGVMPVDQTIIAAGLLRLMTIGGDILFFCMTAAVRSGPGIHKHHSDQTDCS